MTNEQLKSEVEELESFRAKHPNVGLHFKNLKKFPVHHRKMRGTGGAWFDLAGNRTIEAHISEIPPGGHNKKHRHMNEAIIYIVCGRGYSLIQEEGQEEIKIEWEEGDMFSPPLNAWHQHFNSDPDRPARYLAVTNIGLMTKIGAFSKEQAPGQD
ncbi:MAG: cupin domain-containing protein [Anaerolineae bacterium]